MLRTCSKTCCKLHWRECRKPKWIKTSSVSSMAVQQGDRWQQKLFYFMNSTENFNCQLRKVTKNWTILQTEDAFFKLLYFVMMYITKNGLEGTGTGDRHLTAVHLFQWPNITDRHYLIEMRQKKESAALIDSLFRLCQNTDT